MRDAGIMGLAALGGLGALLLLKKSNARYYVPRYSYSPNDYVYTAPDYSPLTPTGGYLSSNGSGYIPPTIPNIVPAGVVSHYIPPAAYVPQTHSQISVPTPGAYLPSMPVQPVSTGALYHPHFHSDAMNFKPAFDTPMSPYSHHIDYVSVTPESNAAFNATLQDVPVTPINPYFAPLDNVPVTPINPYFAPLDYVPVTPVNPAFAPLDYVPITPVNQYFAPLDYVPVTPVNQYFAPLDYVPVTPENPYFAPINYVPVTPQVYIPQSAYSAPYIPPSTPSYYQSYQPWSYSPQQFYTYQRPWWNYANDLTPMEHVGYSAGDWSWYAG